MAPGKAQLANGQVPSAAAVVKKSLADEHLAHSKHLHCFKVQFKILIENVLPQINIDGLNLLFIFI